MFERRPSGEGSGSDSLPAEAVVYVTRNWRDAEALATSLKCRVIVLKRELRGEHSGKRAVRHEFVVLPDARDSSESDFSGKQVPR